MPYWSLHAYPHLVSTYGMSRYKSTNCLLNSVKLRCSSTEAVGIMQTLLTLRPRNR